MTRQEACRFQTSPSGSEPENNLFFPFPGEWSISQLPSSPCSRRSSQAPPQGLQLERTHGITFTLWLLLRFVRLKIPWTLLRNWLLLILHFHMYKIQDISPNIFYRSRAQFLSPGHPIIPCLVSWVPASNLWIAWLAPVLCLSSYHCRLKQPQSPLLGPKSGRQACLSLRGVIAPTGRSI